MRYSSLAGGEDWGRRELVWPATYLLRSMEEAGKTRTLAVYVSPIDDPSDDMLRAQSEQQGSPELGILYGIRAGSNREKLPSNQVHDPTRTIREPLRVNHRVKGDDDAVRVVLRESPRPRRTRLRMFHPIVWDWRCLLCLLHE